MKKSEQVRRALKNWRKGIYATDGICYCLYWSNVGRGRYWCDNIEEMLDGCTYVSTWLESQGIPEELLTKQNMYEYRELWLEPLSKAALSIGE